MPGTHLRRASLRAVPCVQLSPRCNTRRDKRGQASSSILMLYCSLSNLERVLITSFGRIGGSKHEVLSGEGGFWSRHDTKIRAGYRNGLTLRGSILHCPPPKSPGPNQPPRGQLDCSKALLPTCTPGPPPIRTVNCVYFHPFSAAATMGIGQRFGWLAILPYLPFLPHDQG